nr:Mfa1 family fimbria major subunit [Prevotella sp. UBA4952]
MKKLKNVLIVGAVALGLGLTSCSRDDTLSPSTGKSGNTYVAVSLTMPLSSSTRALPDDYNSIGKWVGNDDIKTVDIYLVDGTKADVTHSSFTVGSGTGDGYTASESTDGTQIILTPKTAIKTNVGTKEVYVVLNTTTDITKALSSTSAPDFDKAYKTVALSLANSGTSTTTVSTSASKIAGEETGTDTKQHDVIAMTNSSDVTIDVKSNVTSAQALAASNPQNRASVQVQRAVARVMVTTAATSFDVKSSTGTLLGTVSNITWVLAQGEKSLYVQQNSGFTTPNFAWVPASTGGDADYIANAGSKYDYSGLFENYTAAPSFGGTTVPTLAAYKDPTAAGIGDSSVLYGKFILPTTHTYGSDVTTTGYRKGNTPYVLIRAKFTPAAFADGGTPNADGTFYLGANGKYYTSSKNAVDPTKGGVAGQTVAKYVGGKVLYYAWVNPDNVTTPYNSPVLRNNIYHIHITGFKTIGTNWNPLYPEDPNSSNPTNPDPKPANDDPNDPNNPGEPTNPIDPTDPLTTPETWMSVDVTVLPWNVHSYGISLGI